MLESTVPFSGKLFNLTTALCCRIQAGGLGTVPFLGISLLLLTPHRLAADIGATFLVLVVVFMIDFSRFMNKEHLSA